MGDGVDYRRFYATIAALDPSAQRAARRDLTDWMRAASRSVGWPVQLSIASVTVGAGLVVFGSLFEPSLRVLDALGVIALAVGTGLSLWSNRRARDWRRAHPFEDWRANNTDATSKALANPAARR